MNNHSAQEIRSHVTGLLAQKRDYKQEIKEMTARYTYVVFYGCGLMFNSVIESWNEHIGRRVDYCCDSDNRKWGKYFNCARCLSPTELLAIKDDCAVFITVGDFRPVYNFLKESGFPSVNLLYKYDFHVFNNLSSQDPDDVIVKLCETYSILEDDRSRTVFNAVLKRVLGDGSDIDTMLDVYDIDQYFPRDIIHLSSQERFIDGGAFDGDTIRDFVVRTQGQFSRIFAFELDNANFMELQKNIENITGRDRITIFNLGLFDQECDIDYNIDNLQSSVGTRGQGRAHMVPLDEVLRDEDVTFIKMDIEGAEPQALYGATRLIKAQRPKLAICIYHDFRHVWEIPLYIKSLVPEYKIYFRHHTYLEYETVCYAVL